VRARVAAFSITGSARTVDHRVNEVRTKRPVREEMISSSPAGPGRDAEHGKRG
jgi:hypothetical protein